MTILATPCNNNPYLTPPLNGMSVLALDSNPYIGKHEIKNFDVSAEVKKMIFKDIKCINTI